MGKTIFIKEIITISKEPKLCPTCTKEDRLEQPNSMFSLWGINSNYKSESQKSGIIINERWYNNAKRTTFD